jgi:hypothetical protein
VAADAAVGDGVDVAFNRALEIVRVGLVRYVADRAANGANKVIERTLDNVNKVSDNLLFNMLSTYILTF